MNKKKFSRVLLDDGLILFCLTNLAPWTLLSWNFRGIYEILSYVKKKKSLSKRIPTQKNLLWCAQIIFLPRSFMFLCYPEELFDVLPGFWSKVHSHISLKVKNQTQGDIWSQRDVCKIMSFSLDVFKLLQFCWKLLCQYQNKGYD